MKAEMTAYVRLNCHLIVHFFLTTKQGRRLRGDSRGRSPPKFEVGGTAHAYVPPIFLATVIAIQAKYVAMFNAMIRLKKLKKAIRKFGARKSFGVPQIQGEVSDPATKLRPAFVT